MLWALGLIEEEEVVVVARYFVAGCGLVEFVVRMMALGKTRASPL